MSKRRRIAYPLPVLPGWYYQHVKDALEDIEVIGLLRTKLPEELVTYVYTFSHQMEGVDCCSLRPELVARAHEDTAFKAFYSLF